MTSTELIAMTSTCAVFPVIFAVQEKASGVVNFGGAPGLGVSIDGGAAVVDAIAKDEREGAASTKRVRAQSCCGCTSKMRSNICIPTRTLGVLLRKWD